MLTQHKDLSSDPLTHFRIWVWYHAYLTSQCWEAETGGWGVGVEFLDHFTRREVPALKEQQGILGVLHHLGTSRASPKEYFDIRTHQALACP